tara:strand:- start:6 stop:449 length:444 start_codon:yes stop_codon:yes gene_type:complete
MRETFEEFVAIYQFCNPLEQSELNIIQLVSAELIKEYGEGTITHFFWEGEEDSTRKAAPVSKASYIGIVNLDDTADFQGANYQIPKWDEPARLGNFGDWVGDPTKPSHPDWINEQGGLLMCRGDRAIGYRTLVSQSCRRLIVEVTHD